MKRAKRNIILALIVIAAIVAISAAAVIQNALSPPAQREDKTVFTPTATVVINAQTFSGNIEIKPSVGSQIEVVYSVSAPNGYLNDIKTSANQTTTGNLTTITANAALRANQGVNYIANLVVNVPNTSTYNFSLTDNNGDINIRAPVSNEVAAITDKGNINVALPQGSLFQVTASAVNGKISHQEIPLNATTDSPIRLKGVTPDGAGSLDLTLMSGNGNITLAYV